MKLTTKFLWSFLGSLFVTLNLSAQVLDASTLPVNGGVYAMAEDANYVYVGGDFNHIGGRSTQGEAINTNTQALLNLPRVEGQIFACVGDGNGGWYIGGIFNAVGGVARRNVAHILPNKTLNTTWNPNINFYEVRTLAFAGSHLFAGGGGTIDATGHNISIVKISTAGTGIIDTQWKPHFLFNGNGGIKCLLVSGNDLFVGGAFEAVIGGYKRKSLVKISTLGTGEVDPNWDFSPNSGVSGLGISGTSIFVSGFFTKIGGVAKKHLAKINNVTLQVDTLWNPGENIVSSFHVSGKLIITGENLYVSGFRFNSTQRVAKLSTTGTGQIDTNFVVDASVGDIYDMVGNSQHIYLGGSFININGIPTRGVAKINANTGALDANWSFPHYEGLGCNVVYALGLQNDELYVGGYFRAVGGQERNGIARFLKSDNSLDLTWKPNVKGVVGAMFLQNGNLYIGGTFTQVGGLQRNNLARISTTGVGEVNADWNPSVIGSPIQIPELVKPLPIICTLTGNTNSLYVGGRFSHIGNVPYGNLAKVSLDGEGSVDVSWNPQVNDEVRTLLLSGQELWVGGKFSQVGGTTRKNLAKINAIGAGEMDTQWNPAIAFGDYGIIHSILKSDANLYVAGNFYAVGDTSIRHIAKMNALGAIDMSWKPFPSSTDWMTMGAMAIANQDLFILRQHFVSANLPQKIHKINLVNGTLTDWFLDTNRGHLCAFFEQSTMLITGNNLYVGSQFTKVGGKEYYGYVKIDLSPIVSTYILDGFTTTDQHPSFAQTFQVNGTNFTSDVVINANQNDWEFSIDNIVWQNALSLIPNAGTVSQTVYVRLKAGLTVGNKMAHIAVVAVGKPTATIILQGKITEAIFEVSSLSPFIASTDINLYIDQQTVHISGIGFSGNINVSLSNADWEIATIPAPNTSAVWASSLSLPTTTGTNNTLYFWIRLKQSNSTGNKTGILTLSTTGFAEKSIALSGNIMLRQVTVSQTSLNNFHATTTIPSASKFFYIGHRGHNGLIRLYISNDDWTISFGNDNKIDTILQYTPYELPYQTPIYVRLKAGLTTGAKTAQITIKTFGLLGQTQTITLNGIVTTTGGITTSIDTLSNFTTNTVTPSASKSFVCSAIKLSSNMSVNFSTSDWELSINKTHWITALSLQPVDSIIEDKIVYIRLKAGLTAGIKTGQIYVSGTGLSNQIINISGVVTALGGIAVSTNSLTNFVTNPAFPSASQSFVLNANELTDNLGLSISASEWELSTNSTNWASTLLIQSNNGVIQNQVVYVRLKGNNLVGNKSATIILSSVGYPSQSITLSGAVNGFPIVSTANLTGFFTNSTQPSSSKTFTINGTGFVYDIQIDVPSMDWEMSINNVNWSNSLIFTPTSWTTNSKTIYVRLKAGLAMGNKTAILAVTTLGSNPQNINLSGTVINAPVASLSTDMLQNFQTNVSESSAIQTFTIYGTGFVAHLQASVSTTDWELSQDNNTWTNTLQILPTNGKVDNKMVYVRLKKGLVAGTKTAILTISSPQIESQFIALRGEVIEPTAVLPTLKTEVTVYPNPSNTGKFYVKVGELESDKLQITVVNQQGKTIYQTEATRENETLIDLPTLPKGLYFLRIDTNKGIITKKITRN